AVLERERGGGRRHQLPQRHPVALTRQALEGTVHQLGHGVRGGPSVAGLVTAATAAGAGLPRTDDRDLPVRELRALGRLRLGALLGHRGCLPVTARLVRREPSRSPGGGRYPRRGGGSVVDGPGRTREVAVRVGRRFLSAVAAGV